MFFRPAILALTFLIAMLLSCASADTPDVLARPVQEFGSSFDQDIVVRSSILQFEILNSEKRQASGALVRFGGVLEGGERIDEEYYVQVDRIGDLGNLVVRVAVEDGLFERVNPSPQRRFTGAIEIQLDDPIGTFGTSYLEDVRLEFASELKPLMERVSLGDAFPNQYMSVKGKGILRPEEGQTFVIVTQGRIDFGDGSSRQIANAREALRWSGSRAEGGLVMSPSLFGVRVGEFTGDILFENVLRTGERFVGSSQSSVRVNIQRSKITQLTPEAGSRGQKITIEGRGFVASNDVQGAGMYLTFDGVFTPKDSSLPPQNFTGAAAYIRVPFAVVSESRIAQDVWYDVTPNKQISGLGAVPGVYRGRIIPTLFDAVNEQVGDGWSGEFEVLPPRQVVYVKYLPGFTRALEQFGLANVEQEVRNRILVVLRRDYEGIHIDFRDQVPTDFIEYTTIEIGGPDPSGLLNFGYDNSFNDGGKDIGNVFLGDYLGGVNRHSQEAGYLPYGGVFIESFVAFSPKLFPSQFGASTLFDETMGKVMPALDGTPVSVDEWPDGPRTQEIEAAVRLIGNLTGHTASHEIGHALGLAHFPPSVPNFEQRYHNDPPGPGWIMDSGADRPFEERAEVGGVEHTRFSPRNLSYLQSILSPP